MMAHCFTPIRGRRMRVTKVNSLGRPVYGTNAFVVTGGFVSVQFTPQVQEGEEITVRTADGSLCVSERGCDELQWIQVQIEFCQVDPCLFTLINETWTELRDCDGEVIGWAESYKFSCDSGFALELWTDVTGYTPTTTGAQGAWGYMLLPFIIGGTLGEQTVENGAISFTITGRTKKGSGWGVGPYDVMCNDPETGACGPLLTPVGAEEPRRIMLTTCRPPAAACGCQPLSSPDGPVFTAAENTTDPNRRTVTATLPTGAPGTTYRISWGDGTPVQDIVPGTPLNHQYDVTADKPRTFNIAVWDAANPQRVSVRTVTVPFQGAVVPVFTVAQEGADSRAVRLNVTNAASGRAYEVRWKATDVGWQDIPAGTPPTITHTYTAADDGQVVITVRDRADTNASSQQTITIPLPPAVTPTITVAQEGSNTRAARVNVTNAVSGRTYEVQWKAGDGWADLTGAPPTGTHTYVTGDDGQVAVTVRDKADTSKSVQQTITIPFPVPPQLLVTEQGGDATRRTTRVTVTNPQPGVTYEVSWAGASGPYTAMPTTGTPPHSATHQQTTGASMSVVVRQVGAPANQTTQNVQLPYSGPQFTLAQEGTETNTVRVTIENPAGGAAYSVAWEGDTWENLPTTGTPHTGTHTYANGTHQVRVRDNAQTNQIATQQVTVPFPAALAGADEPNPSEPEPDAAQDQDEAEPTTAETSATSRKRK